jgi:hypothetical protein
LRYSTHRASLNHGGSLAQNRGQGVGGGEHGVIPRSGCIDDLGERHRGQGTTMFAVGSGPSTAGRAGVENLQTKSSPPTSNPGLRSATLKRGEGGRPKDRPPVRGCPFDSGGRRRLTTTPGPSAINFESIRRSGGERTLDRWAGTAARGRPCPPRGPRAVHEPDLSGQTRRDHRCVRRLSVAHWPSGERSGTSPGWGVTAHGLAGGRKRPEHEPEDAKALRPCRPRGTERTLEGGGWGGPPRGVCACIPISRPGSVSAPSARGGG